MRAGSRSKRIGVDVLDLIEAGSATEKASSIRALGEGLVLGPIASPNIGQIPSPLSLLQ